MKIVAATANPGKIREIRQILSGRDVLSLKDIGFTGDIPETADTFLENAAIKSQTVYDRFHDRYPDACFLADDSGLEVDALGGRPGVLSARYAGPGATSEQMIAKLLDEMKTFRESDRTARFLCTMVLIDPSGRSYFGQGVCEGRIAVSPRGENGFGYDPVFLVESRGYDKTMAELSDDEKNSLSHRRHALEAVRNILRDLDAI